MNNYNFDDLIFFDYTGNEKNVVIPEGVLRIEAGAFKGNKDIVCVYLPKSLIYLGDEAFSGCTSLIKVSIAAQLENTGKAAFKGCTALERKLRNKNAAPTENIAGVIENDTLIHFDDTYTDCLTIPSSVKYIAAGAFSGCNNLVSVTILDTVEDIEEGAFDDCPNLEEVNIPDGSDIIDQYSLADTKWYRDNKDGFFILGGTLLGYNGKSGDIIVPPSVRRIADDVLDSLRSCRCISLPSTMTEMPDIPSEGFTDPIVSVYEVDPGRALCRL